MIERDAVVGARANGPVRAERADYTPVPLLSHVNVGIDLFDRGRAPSIGKRTFHGLPFEIGDEPTRCFIGLGGGAAEGARAIRIASTARHVIIAHTLLESRLTEGENVGRVVAHYV